MRSEMGCALALVAVAMSAVGQVGSQPNATKFDVSGVEDSLVKIVVVSQLGINSVGTGFFVGSGNQVASAGHVYLEAERAIVEAGVGELAAYKVLADGKKILIPISFSKADFSHDLVILTFDANAANAQHLAVRPLSLSDARPQVGHKVGFMGYFAGDEHPVLSQTIIAGYTSNPPAAEQLILDLPANPGQSGSPVFDLESGEVVGVLASFVPVVLVPGGLPTHSGLSRSVEVVHLKRLSESADVR